MARAVLLWKTHLGQSEVTTAQSISAAIKSAPRFTGTVYSAMKRVLYAVTKFKNRAPESVHLLHNR